MGWCGDVSSTLNHRALYFYYYCIGSWRLGTPGLEDLEASPPFCWARLFSIYLLVALGPPCLVGFSLVLASRGYSCCRARAVGCSGFCRFSRALENRLSSCGAWTSLLNSMFDLPGPGTELCIVSTASAALPGRFFTTEPPGNPWARFCANIHPWLVSVK